jgi:trehalose 6-phosphate phosphatase
MIPDTSSVVGDPQGTLLALDFDGTLAHIVDDPAVAFGHRHAIDALARIGPLIGQVAIVTGRPVRQLLELGGFEGRPGFETLVVCGQYGAERWDASGGSPGPSAVPEPVQQALRLLPDVLASHDAAEARIEPKGLAVAVHTRGMGAGVRDGLVPPLSKLADQLGLVVELGREVVELRLAGWDKGRVLRELVEEFAVRQVVFAGDDLGDLPAFEAVDRMRAAGSPAAIGGLLICSASDEQSALMDLADLVVDGPEGVAAWLGGLADALERTS